MTDEERTAVLEGVRQRYTLIAPYLAEHPRRLWAAAEALTIGWHGITIVHEATGLSRVTLTKAQQELRQPAPPRSDWQRQRGGGRKPLTETDPTLLRDLDRLVDPFTRGDPESPLRWTCKSTYHLAEALQQQGHVVSQATVYRLLAAEHYSMQSNRKTEEGADHPDRDAQFQFIYQQVKKFPAGRPAGDLGRYQEEGKHREFCESGAGVGADGTTTANPGPRFPQEGGTESQSLWSV